MLESISHDNGGVMGRFMTNYECLLFAVLIILVRSRSKKAMDIYSTPEWTVAALGPDTRHVTPLLARASGFVQVSVAPKQSADSGGEHNIPKCGW